MRSIHQYDIYIFDCDGVILDSNQLKIDAMETALISLSFKKEDVFKCVDYFRNNFGKSRFHHVDVFINEILNVKQNADSIKLSILEAFSTSCKHLYLEANLTPGIIDFIKCLAGKKYIASGSEQQELISVFKERGLYSFFSGIYGSPTKKMALIENILSLESTTNAVMIGDAVSDWEAATANGIDFIFYSPFSNVKYNMMNLYKKHGFMVIENFIEEINQ